MKAGKAENNDFIHSGLGVSIADYDGIDKVRGTLKYADDLYLDDLLYGKIVFSKYPHARILGIDINDAHKSPGVLGIYTRKRYTGNKQNRFNRKRSACFMR